MSSAGAASRAAAALGAPTRVAAPKNDARADASRQNGAKSRGPKTAEGKARSSQNALKHGLRAKKYVVLPDEDAPTLARHPASALAPGGLVPETNPSARRAPNEPEALYS